ncbi:MAG: serine/threonine-protein kinase, partial [Candidatus Competibacterales bacterium]|nr:serine/threonine-protein kinase [Candidatus Competibacterales bacterium]
MSESMVKVPGYRIPGYKIEREVGRGGMATVYLALQESLNRHVALKVMNPALSADEDFRLRFLNEGHIVGQLNHSNIVTVFDIGNHDTHYYLSMEYLPGGSLRERIRDGLPLKRCINIARTLARALSYAHQRGFIHRDIKPPNVLFREDGSPVLTDFGIAKALGASSQLTRTGYAFGSVGYMSPEQALGKPIDHRSDIYSFGVMFWEMLTGQKLYRSEDAFALALKHATAPIPQVAPELARFQPILLRLLAKQPEQRYERLDEFVAALDELEPVSETGPRPTSSADSTVVRPDTHRNVPTAPAETPAVSSSERPTPAGRWGLLGLTAGVLVLIGAGSTVLLIPGLNPLQPSAEPPTVNDQATTTQPEPLPASDNPAVTETPPPAAPTPVAELLDRAERQWQAGQYTEPPDDNAFATYEQVLAQDPDHPLARSRLLEIGRQQLGRQYEDRARRLLAEGKLE